MKLSIEQLTDLLIASDIRHYDNREAYMDTLESLKEAIQAPIKEALAACKKHDTEETAYVVMDILSDAAEMALNGILEDIVADGTVDDSYTIMDVLENFGEDAPIAGH